MTHDLEICPICKKQSLEFIDFLRFVGAADGYVATLWYCPYCGKEFLGSEKIVLSGIKQ